MQNRAFHVSPDAKCDGGHLRGRQRLSADRARRRDRRLYAFLRSNCVDTGMLRDGDRAEENDQRSGEASRMLFLPVNRPFRLA